MTRKDKIQLQQSKLRGKLNSLLDVDAAERTDDQAGELAALMAEAQRLEVDFQSDSVLWPYIARNCQAPERYSRLQGDQVRYAAAGSTRDLPAPPNLKEPVQPLGQLVNMLIRLPGGNRPRTNSPALRTA